MKKIAKNIMIQGTGSSVGKSIIAAALCRIFFQDGHRVAPFKSQNMALNSFVTEEGLEMGRAQVVQAQACGIKPSALMNPILLKPSTDKKAQVIINGRVYKNLDAKGYHDYKSQARSIVEKAYSKLQEQFDIIVIEGAGSPAEINLRDNDIVNMGMAEIADTPVILVADIDKGGVFASIVGTIFLLSEEEKERVKGVIINKFRGDIDLLKPGITMLEEIIKIPVLGVIPYTRIALEDEDSVTERLQKNNGEGEINIDIIKLPYMSNFTDFDVFALFEDVNIRYVDAVEEIKNPDVVIIPGSKNTIEDLIYIKSRGIDKRILELYNDNKMIIGICGGYQMLGRSIEDPCHVESDIPRIEGIGIIDMMTTLAEEKITKQVSGEILVGDGILNGLKGVKIKGYEIHMGNSIGEIEKNHFVITESRGSGTVDNNVIGTYIHGIFDNNEFTRKLLNNIREKKGLNPIETDLSFDEYREEEFNRLANIVRNCIDIKKIYHIMES